MTSGVRAAPRQSRLWRRRVVLASAVLGGTTLALAVAAELTRRSDAPRRLVVSALREATGLDVRIVRLRTRWSGNTVAHDVEVRLPLEGRALMQVHRVRVRHAGLLRLALTRDVGLVRIEVDRPRVQAHRDDLGRWNVQSALIRVANAADARPSATQTVVWPGVVVRDGAVTIVGSDGAATTLGLHVDARPIDGGEWEFEAGLNGLGAIRGRMETTAPREHRVEFDLSPRHDVLRVLLNVEQSVLASGLWRGVTDGEGLRGRLSIQRADVGGILAAGAAAVEIGRGAVRVEPARLTFESAAHSAVGVNGGRVDFEGSQLTVAGVRLDYRGIRAAVEGSADLARRSARVEMAWEGEAGEPLGPHSGEATLGLTTSALTGVHSIKGTVRARGNAWDGAWAASADVAGSGLSLESMNGTVEFPRLEWERGDRPLDLSGLAAGVVVQGASARLASLRIPDAGTTWAAGNADLRTGAFDAAISVRGWRPPGLELGGCTVDADMTAAGDESHITVTRLRLAMAEAELVGRGSYSLARESALEATVDVDATWPLTIGAEPPEASARVRARVTTAGDATPLALEFDARVEATDLSVRGRRVGDVTALCRGTVDREGARLTCDEFGLLDGTWSLAGAYTVADQTAALQATCTDIDLSLVAAIAGLHAPVAGRADAAIAVGPVGADLAEARLDAAWSVRGLSAGPLLADRGNGRLHARDGRIVLSEAILENQAGSIHAQAEAAVAAPHELRFGVEAKEWLLSWEALDVVLHGAMHGSADLIAGVANAEGEVAAGVRYGGRDAGRLESPLSIVGRTLNAGTVRVSIAGGALTGRAEVPLDDWASLTADAAWEGIDAARLAGLIAPVPGLAGTLSGTASAAKDDGPHAAGALSVRVGAAVESGAYRGVPIEGVNLTLRHWPGRTTLDAMEVQGAGGVATVWATTTMHGEERFVQARVDADGLDLEPMVRAVSAEAGEVPGRLAVGASVAGYTRSPHRLFGEGTVAVSESDLTALPVLSLIYDGLHLGIRGEPRGEGRALLRMEGNTLQVARLQYFNRGTDVLLTGKLHDVAAGAESEITGLAVGMARPTMGLNVPLARQMDRILAAVQSNAVSVRIGGTAGSPDVRVAPFSEVGDALRGLILGEPP